MFLRSLLWLVAGSVNIFISSTFAEPKLFEKVKANDVRAVIEKMPLKVKVGQLFLSPLYSSNKLSKEARVFLEKTQLGNVIYFRWANELSSSEKIKRLSDEINTCIQQNTGLVPFIAVDQEGGRVQPFKGEGFSVFPSPRQLVLATEFFLDKALENTKATAKKIAHEMLQVGTNLNLAPVVDVDSNLENPIINSRSFSKDPNTVVLFAKAFIEGLHEGGVLATLKHFPGHGDVTVDSHLGLPVVKKNRKELDKVELFPFAQLADKADFIMTAHLKVDALDPDNIATCSPRILQGLLREELGFKGVVISDSLVMRGASLKQATFEEAVKSVSTAAIKAFLAGCDLLILASLEWADFKTDPEKDLALISQVMENFKQAVEKGVISEQRLDASLARILKLKQKL